MKFLDIEGVKTLWEKVKGHVKANVTDKLGKANGIATLDASSKLTASQLPALKTINNTSIVGSGNIAIDLSLYKVVSTLPTSGADVNKIYLVINPDAVDGNEYSEYIYTNNKWELLGQYKADVDLTPYVKFTDVATTSKNGAMSKEDKEKLDGIDADANNYTLPTASASTLGGIKVGANLSITGGVLAGNYSNASASTAGLMSTAHYTKLEGITSGATADEAITTAELEAVLV